MMSMQKQTTACSVHQCPSPTTPVNDNTRNASVNGTRLMLKVAAFQQSYATDLFTKHESLRHPLKAFSEISQARQSNFIGQQDGARVNALAPLLANFAKGGLFSLRRVRSFHKLFGNGYQSTHPRQSLLCLVHMGDQLTQKKISNGESQRSTYQLPLCLLTSQKIHVCEIVRICFECWECCRIIAESSCIAQVPINLTQPTSNSLSPIWT